MDIILFAIPSAVSKQLYRHIPFKVKGASSRLVSATPSAFVKTLIIAKDSSVDALVFDLKVKFILIGDNTI